MAVRKELEVIERTCDLLRWSLPVLGSLARSHRFVIGERVERHIVGVLEELLRAKYAREKRAHLEEASICLDLVRYQVRVLADDGMIKPGSYGEFAERLDVIGRQVGAWMRSGHGREPVGSVR